MSTFIFVARPLLGQRTYLAVDLLEQTAPYRDAIARPPDIASPLQGDQVEQFGPAAILSDRSLEDLEWQTWDPHIAAGTPAAIPPLTANVAPFNWTYFVLPAWYAVGLTAALAIFACQWCMYFFLRRLGVAMLPAIVGAIAYGFTGTNIVFIHRIWAPFLLPALLWAVHRLVDRPTFPAGLVLGGFVAWAWYEGFPSAWVYCMATTVGFAAVLLGVRWFRMARADSAASDASVRRAWLLPRVGMLGFGLAWGVALSSLTLMPFLHELSGRDVLSARVFDSNSHLESINVFGLLTSEVPGPPARGPWWTSLNPYEGTAYLGLAVVAIVAVGLLLASFRRLHASSDGEMSFMFFSTVGVLVIVLSYIGTPLLALVYRVPGFANNPIWRTRFLVGFAAAVLVALTLDSVWRHRLRVVRDGSVLAWWSRATFVALAVIFIWFAPRFLDAAGGAAAREDLVRNGAITVGVLGVVLAAVRWPRLVVAAAAVTGVVIYLELIVPGYDFTPAAPKSDFYTQQSGHRTLKRLTGDRFRYAASGHNFTWNTSDVFGSYDLRGVALHAPEFRKLMHEVSVQAFVPNPFNILIDRDAWNLASPVLDHLGVRYFALGTDEMPYGSPDRQAVAPAWWVPIDAGHAVELLTPVERIDGIVLPLRSTGSCTTGTVRVRLNRGGTMTATSRPLHDVNGTPLAFAIKSPAAAGGLTLRFDATNPGCNLELGVGADGSFAGAILSIDDGSPVRLVSTNQAWIYERPSASPIVTSYGRWTRLKTQTEALDWLRNRPANDAGEVPVVGDVPSSDSGQAARVIERKIQDESVTARVQGETRSLVSAGQVVGNGWKAAVDGKESKMVLVDGGIMATPVPPGAHRVEFRYAPKTVRTGALLSDGAVIVAVVGLVTLGVRRRRRSRPKPGHRAEVRAERVPEMLEGSRGT